MSRAIPGVLWEEGQMLLPQHLQAAQNHYQELVSQLTLGRTYSYGVKSMQIREASIGNWAFEVPSCEIVMPDGTYLVAGETAEIAPVEFRQLQTEGSTLEVWLGIPFFTSSGPNLLDGSSSEEATGAFGRRYIAASMELRDENSGGNPQEIRCRKLNARIFVGRRPEQGYTTLKIAELKKVNVEGDDGRVYALSEQFVPASLSLEAAPRLFRIVRDLLDILEEKNEELHHQLGREDMFSGDQAKYLESLLKLQSTNGAMSVLRQIASQPSMHPFDVYLHLTRLIGDISIFSSERTPPRLPVYKHEDPLAAFLALSEHWVVLLSKTVYTPVERVEFKETESKNVLGVDIPRSYLAPKVDLVLGIETTLPATEVEDLFRDGGVILAAPSDLAGIRRARTPGISCVQDKSLHPGLKGRQGLVFLAISRSPELWKAVEESARLALAGALVGDARFYLFATNVAQD